MDIFGLLLFGTEEAATNSVARWCKRQRRLTFEQGIVDTATDKQSQARSLSAAVAPRL